MKRTGRRAGRCVRLALAVAVLCMPAAMAAGAPPCLRTLAGFAPLRIDDGFITLQASLNGRDVSLIVDTGAETALLTPDAVAGLALPPDPAHRTRLRGTGGAGGTVGNALMPPVALQGLTLPGGSVPVEALPAMPVLATPVAGLLGADSLGRFDVEFDLPHRRILFWRIRLGSMLCAPPPLWHGPFRTAPFTLRDGRPVLDARLDGQRITALLDSGARSRVLSPAAAAQAGVGADALGADPGGVSAGIDGRDRVYHWHRFRSLAVGGELVADPVLTVAPVADTVDLLLGADWFNNRDVWVSYATGMVFSRTGNTSAEAPPRR